MTTGMMLPVARQMDQAGFEGIELISGSRLKKTVRELKEDPWERVRLVAKEISKTPLRVIARRVNTFEYNPPSMYWLFIERMFANGIREARISDSRGYLIRNSAIVQITQDQSLVAHLVASGVLTPEKAKLDRRRNVILQALRTQKQVGVGGGVKERGFGGSL